MIQFVYLTTSVIKINSSITRAAVVHLNLRVSGSSLYCIARTLG